MVSCGHKDSNTGALVSPLVSNVKLLVIAVTLPARSVARNMMTLLPLVSGMS